MAPQTLKTNPLNDEEFFVSERSIVRKIWADSDMILFIFAGAAAEFVLNKAVDWLYYTGKIPRDPLGRMFSTVDYARKIVFETKLHAHHAIQQIVNIHTHVESARHSAIPMEAYRDVLYMLIYYSITAYEILEMPMSHDQKEDVYNVFLDMGSRMNISDLPTNYDSWLHSREEHLAKDLMYSRYTKNLFIQYKKHLGAWRYYLLRMLQSKLLPTHANGLLNIRPTYLTSFLLQIFKATRKNAMNSVIKFILIPSMYRQQIASWNRI